MEHRTADTLTRLNQAERQLKEQRQAAYEVRASKPACAQSEALTRRAVPCRTL